MNLSPSNTSEFADWLISKRDPSKQKPLDKNGNSIPYQVAEIYDILDGTITTHDERKMYCDKLQRLGDEASKIT